MTIFTFGRDHEKKCEAAYVRNSDQRALLMVVIDTVHDLIEGKGSLVKVEGAIKMAFIAGGSGVWESAGKWLRKTSAEYPAVLRLWRELGLHPKAEVRFRVACFLNEMPKELSSELGPQLKSDRSIKVKNMAQARMEELNG